MKNKRPNVIAKYEKREPPTKRKDSTLRKDIYITQITEYTLVPKLYEILQIN